jgi:hypothetical protein
MLENSRSQERGERSRREIIVRLGVRIGEGLECLVGAQSIA